MVTKSFRNTNGVFIIYHMDRELSYSKGLKFLPLETSVSMSTTKNTFIMALLSPASRAIISFSPVYPIKRNKIGSAEHYH